MTKQTKKMWRDYIRAVEKYVKDLKAWAASQTITTLDDGSGSNPPPPPPPPPPPTNT